MIKCSGCDHISLIGHALGGKVYIRIPAADSLSNPCCSHALGGKATRHAICEAAGIDSLLCRGLVCKGTDCN